MKLGMSWIDWKLGGRMLVKFPGLSIIGGLTLAVTIGLGAAWFEVTQQIVNPRLPLPDGDRIVRIENWDAAESEVESRSLYDFQLWREQLTTIKELGAYRALERNLITADGNGYPFDAAEITASAFPLTRVSPLLGRALVESDAEPGAPDVVLIGYEVWQSRFGGARDVIGRTVKVDRTPVTIVGVMPEGFTFPVSQQLWVPLRMTRALPREGPDISVFGRLAPGATLESAQAELALVGQRIAAMNASTHAQLRPHVASYASIEGEEGPLLRITNLIAWLILVAAAANVATLMFARTATREAEIIVRSALGASRVRVMMQLFVEAFVLCAVAAVVGLTAASFALDYGMRLFLWAEPGTQLPFWFQFDIGPVTVVYAAALAFAGAVVVGLLPAIRATGPRVQTALTQMTGGSTSMQFGGVWSVLIVLQVATAALCLPFGTLAAFWTLYEPKANTPFPTHEYVTFQPELDPDATLTTTGELRAEQARAHLSNVYAELKRRLETEASVVAVTFADGLPLDHSVRQVEAQRGSDPPFLVDAYIEGDQVRTSAVDIGFFDAFRLPLVAGRAFHAGDVDADRVVIINETLARNIGGNALGVRVRLAPKGEREASPWYEVIGIVRNDAADVTGGKEDYVFRPVSVASVTPLVVGVHVRGDGASFAPRVRALATDVEPGLRMDRLETLDAILRREHRLELRGMYAMLAITLLMMALSAAGLYSLMSVAVTRRTREIGIRLAIGASPQKVLAALFARAAIQVGIGVIVANTLLPSLMTAMGISELKWTLVVPAMLIASGGMLLTGLVACGVPARKALRIQPTEAVRYAG